MNWIRNRYRKQWYVVSLDADGRSTGSAGPLTWPRAERLREELRRVDVVEHTHVIRRTPGEPRQ